jgi:hypothetical protein
MIKGKDRKGQRHIEILFVTLAPLLIENPKRRAVDLTPFKTFKKFKESEV